jgi:RNA polymerase sigma-70 factor (ECF subfamily)
MPAFVEAFMPRALTRARSAWPEVVLAEDRFAEALAERLSAGEDPMIALDTMLVEDVYLVTACVEGDERAMAYMDRQYFPAARATLVRLGVQDAAIEETLQELRRQLFVERPPKASSYKGRGSFRGWLRAVAGRMALRERRRAARNVSWKESAADAGEADDPDLAYMRRKYAEPFQLAFQETLRGLSVDDRLLLKQRFAHRLNLEELAGIHGVHVSTVSRRVTDARERLVSGTRDALMRRVDVGRAEASSIMRLIQSELDVTLSSTAARPPDDGPG